MIKNFFANVDGDKIHFFSIDINNDGLPVDSQQVDKDYALSSDPLCLNISNLNYFPAKRSIWDGESFIPPNGESHRPSCNPVGLCLDGCESIAFIVNSIYYGGIGLCIGVANNDMVIAALSSNPSITFEIE